jgi:hypothetical protein
MQTEKRGVLDEEGRSGVLSELWSFMAHNKKWWLTPVIVMLLLLGVLVVLGSSGAAPFIYTLF